MKPEDQRWGRWGELFILLDFGSESLVKLSIAFSFICCPLLSRHRTLMNIFEKASVIDRNVFVAPSTSILGDVHVGPCSSIWYGCVLRGDANSISIGSGTNILDNSLVHVEKSILSGKVLPTIVGNKVTIGHNVVLHSCTVKDEAFVGATLLDGVWAGNPAKFLRKLTDEEIVFIWQSATNYSNLAQAHATENAKSFDEIEFEKVLRKNFARPDEDYDSVIGVVRETPPELVLPDNILLVKAQSA